MQTPRLRRLLPSSLAAGLSAVPNLAIACPNCATSNEVWSLIQASSPGATLGILSLAFTLVAGLIVLTARMMPRARLLTGAALLLGAGFGAFIDGIVLHQVLQWHAMISSVLAPVDLAASKANMFWDGIFHLYSWLAALTAIILIVRELPHVERQARHRIIAGGMLAGWGYFNVVEGIIDHHIFQIHHVHPGVGEMAWDVAFLIMGVLLSGAGAWITVPVLRSSTSR